MKKILFVCTGNTCRSAMAQAFFNSFLKSENPKYEHLKNEYYADSAGIAASPGAPASDNAITAMRENWGISLDEHRSKSISEELVKDAFLILPMTFNQSDIIVANFPELEGITHILQEYVNPDCHVQTQKARACKFNIIDPYGLPLQSYIQAAEEIRKAVEKLIERLP